MPKHAFFKLKSVVLFLTINLFPASKTFYGKLHGERDHRTRTPSLRIQLPDNLATFRTSSKNLKLLFWYVVVFVSVVFDKVAQ